jgi:hypothetical protein
MQNSLYRQPFQHQPVEGHLEAVFDLGLDTGFHVANQDAEAVVGQPLQPQQVHVAAQRPAVQFGHQPGLEQQDRLAGPQLARLVHDLPVVVWAVMRCGKIGVIDGAEVLAEGFLDALLELVARQRQERRDVLGVHVVVFHELLPGPFRQAEAQEALAAPAARTAKRPWASAAAGVRRAAQARKKLHPA